MKNLFILSALISFTILTACNKQEIEEVLVSVDQESPSLLPANNEVDIHDFSSTGSEGKANFIVNNKDNIISEIRKIYPLQEVKEAIGDYTSQMTGGKILLRMS